MDTVCFDCTKYDPTDRLAQILAYLCSAPYFAIFYQASVRSRDNTSCHPFDHPVVILNSQGTLLFSLGFTREQTRLACPQVVYSRRELHGITALLGMVACAALSKGLKRLLRQARPLAGCELLGSCLKHGMPSSHAQLMFFMWALHALLAFRRRPRSRAQALFQLLESVFLWLLSVAVAAGRVYLGYHDVAQVAVGAAVGCGFALVWYAFTAWLAREWLGRVVRGPLSDILRLNDTFPLGPDVLSWERGEMLPGKHA